jgi:hypothetical protein
MGRLLRPSTDRAQQVTSLLLLLGREGLLAS